MLEMVKSICYVMFVLTLKKRLFVAFFCVYVKMYSLSIITGNIIFICYKVVDSHTFGWTVNCFN